MIVMQLCNSKISVRFIFLISAFLSILSVFFVYPTHFAEYRASNAISDISSLSSNDLDISRDSQGNIVLDAKSKDPCLYISGLNDYSGVTFHFDEESTVGKFLTIKFFPSYMESLYENDSTWIDHTTIDSGDDSASFMLATYMPEGKGSFMVQFVGLYDRQSLCIKKISIHSRHFHFSFTVIVYVFVLFVSFALILFIISNIISRMNITGLGLVSLFILLANCYYWLINILSRGQVLEYYFASAPYSTFSDFFDTMAMGKYGSEQYFETLSNHPPLCHLIYRFLYMQVPEYLASKASNDEDMGSLLKSTQHSMMAYVLFVILSCLICALLIRHIMAKAGYTNINILLTQIAVLTCAPMLFTIERGNIILIAFILTLFYIFAYDSENPVVSELALISLAFAAALKIYPAVYGLLLLKEHKWKKAIRCVIYGIMLFILPFIYYSGLDGFGAFMKGMSTSVNFVYGYGYNLSAYNAIKAFVAFTGVKVFPKIYRYAVLFLAVTISPALLFTKKKSVTILACTLLLLALPKMSYFYVGLFILIPLLYDYTKKERIDIQSPVFTLFYVIELSIIPVGFIRSISYGYKFPTSVDNLVKFTFVLLMCVYLLYYSIRERRSGQISD
jgi:hypothetical protein